MINDPTPISILIIDDEDNIRDGCERILSAFDCQVYKASNGEEGLDLLAKYEVSIVFCDIKMPGIDGLEVLNRIQKMDRTLLMIMITGFATIEIAISSMKQGAYDFLTKPFTPDQLRIVTKRAIEKVNLIKEAETLRLERERNLADLNTEQSRIRTILEILPIGIFVTNSLGRVVLINPVALRYLGLSKDRQAGDKIETYISDQLFCKAIQNVSACASLIDEPPLTYEFVNADERYIMAQCQPVLGADTECLGSVINLIDITTMKVFDRLKSEFVAKVSHELRSPLATIHEQLAMVLSDSTFSTSEDSHYMLDRAKEKTQNLISLIGDLLDLSRIEAGGPDQNPVPVQIVDILGKIIDFLKVRATAKEQILAYDYPPTPPSPVLADPMALESIFGNLITNALKYTPNKGKIAVKITPANEQIVIAVTDNGFGIEKKDQEKIFEKFYRVKNAETRFITGTGLGLPIVKNLVESLGGNISVVSEPGRGSTFTVKLPCVQEGV